MIMHIYKLLKIHKIKFNLKTKMKKFYFLMLMFATMLFASCNSCKQSDEATVNSDDVVGVALEVERLIAMDREDMYVQHGENYRWFETCMKLKNFLDEENDGSLEEVVNVFQVAVGDEKTFDVKVYKFQHFADGTHASDSVNGFWVEDQPMNDEAVLITYKEAYDKLMATNMPKPHSQYVTLRKQVGPFDANPQYIFGNLRETVFVDAVTGEVRNYNPAFEDGKGGGFKMPLGEWP